MLDPDYREAVGGRLVLSSAEFGRAYLAESWATEFIRAAIERYRIVFVGYTADDPPVPYLLEALNRGNPVGRMGRVLTAMLDHDPALAREPKFAELRRRQTQAG
jgi:hypothetical protein